MEFAEPRRLSSTVFSIIPVMAGRRVPPKKRTPHRSAKNQPKLSTKGIGRMMSSPTHVNKIMHLYEALV